MIALFSESSNVVTSSGTTITASDAATQLGSIIYFRAQSANGTTFTGLPTDSFGSVFNFLGTSNDGTNTVIGHWWAISLGSGANVVSVGLGGASTQRTGIIAQIRGGGASSPIDGQSSNFGTPTTALNNASSGNATNANQPALIVGTAWSNGGVQTIAAGTGFTIGQSNVASSGGVISTESQRIVTSGSGVAATFTLGFSEATNMVMAIFDEAAASVGAVVAWLT